MTRPDLPATVALDACAAIAAVRGEPAAPIVDRVIEAARAGRIGLYASTMLLVEARGQGIKGCTFDLDLEADVLDRLTQPHWRYVELDRTTALKARELTSRYGLGNPDAVHLASAILAGVDVFMTLDEDDFPIDTDVDGVWISLPYPPEGDDLFVNQDDGYPPDND